MLLSDNRCSYILLLANIIDLIGELIVSPLRHLLMAPLIVKDFVTLLFDLCDLREELLK